MDWQSSTVSVARLHWATATHNRNSIVVDVGNFVQFFFDFGMLSLRSAISQFIPFGRTHRARRTYSTPPGWRLVLLTLLLETMTPSELE